MNIAIAGFGVAGGALAVLLARAGHGVTVFERAPQPGPVGAGLLRPRLPLNSQRRGLSLRRLPRRASPRF